MAAFDSASYPQQRPGRAAISHMGGFSETDRAGPQVSSRRAPASGGFGDATVPASLALRKIAARATSAGVEILFKPRPSYTKDARRLQIEGEVLLDMLFGASGEAKILRVARGLGHGLDETAIAAAREIRFRPAQRDGEPIDSTAVVHITFQLAY